MRSNIVLLVEDNPDDVELALRAFKKHNITNEVVVARDGAEALDFLFATGEYAGRDTKVMPAVVMLDLKIPKVDGLEVLRHIRADERTEFLPVVIFTTSNQEEDLVNSYKLGVNSYARKPVDLPQFSELVRQLGQYWVFVNEVPARG